MQYADFEYYKTEFCGAVITTKEAFDTLEVKARAYVDKLTFDRAKDHTEDEGVKKAVCACCEVYRQYSGHEGISSEDNDGYRVTYLSNSRLRENNLYRSAVLYLPTGLMYRGWDG